jgi:hypothetical protein
MEKAMTEPPEKPQVEVIPVCARACGLKSQFLPPVFGLKYNIVTSLACSFLRLELCNLPVVAAFGVGPLRFAPVTALGCIQMSRLESD